jgi:L-amino acid N-acyltransferase YncA
MPRPNRDYAGSTYSLPSLGSGINVSDSGLNSTDKSATDIRNTIGLKPSIYKSGNTWTKYNWSNPYGRDEDEKLLTKSYLVPFIGAWMAGIPDKSPVSFHQDADGHWRRDIDTDTGRLLEPVSYPESMADPTPLDPQVDWRRQNWTSTLLRHRYTTRRFGKNKRPNQRNCPDYEEPAIVDENLGEDLAVKVEEPVIERPQFHRFVPKIPSFLRPAEKCDMEAVRAIYNWEVENGVQALDSQPLSVEDFEKILAISQQLGMPFIVAVRGSARDLGLTRGNLSFSVFQQVPFYEQDKRGEVLGFAFLSVWQPGLRGNPTGSSRATAKANVFVHPDYRRKKIGFSLLDMLLTTVSDCFSSETAYDFIDPDNSQVFRKASDGKRQVFKVYLSYRIRHKLRTDGNKQLEDEQKTYDDDLVWVKKILEDGLNFSELVRYEAVHRSPKGREGPVCWFDEVVFEHTCAFDPNVVAADY